MRDGRAHGRRLVDFEPHRGREAHGWRDPLQEFGHARVCLAGEREETNGLGQAGGEERDEKKRRNTADQKDGLPAEGWDQHRGKQSAERGADGKTDEHCHDHRRATAMWAELRNERDRVWVRRRQGRYR